MENRRNGPQLSSRHDDDDDDIHHSGGGLCCPSASGYKIQVLREFEADNVGDVVKVW